MCIHIYISIHIYVYTYIHKHTHSKGGMIATAGGRDVLIWDIGYLLDYEESKTRPLKARHR